MQGSVGEGCLDRYFTYKLMEGSVGETVFGQLYLPIRLCRTVLLKTCLGR